MPSRSLGRSKRKIAEMAKKIMKVFADLGLIYIKNTTASTL